jgi:hypothetical protein
MEGELKEYAMSTFWKTALAFMFFAGFGACSQVKFDKISNCQNSGYTCELICQDDNNCIETFSNLITVPEAQVDLLFIIDNSASMSPEHKNLADNFNGLFDKIKHLDYRIAITTTDVSASDQALAYISDPQPYTGLGVQVPEGAIQSPLGGFYQNGRFLPFNIKGSQPFLHKDLGSPTEIENAFVAALDKMRYETQYCESMKNNQAYCASGDERGIYAMNLALQNNKGTGFFRQKAHLAVVIVSDEDVRSFGVDNPVGCDPSYQLGCFDKLDRAESFIENLKYQYPLKTLGVHSIVTDSASCVNIQKKQIYVKGQPDGAGVIGVQYRKFSDMTGGHKGSVCANNYTAQLGQIGSTVLEQVNAVPLACRPIGDHVEVEFINPPAPNVVPIIEAEQMRVRFEPALPPGTKLKLHYDCHL